MSPQDPYAEPSNMRGKVEVEVVFLHKTDDGHLMIQAEESSPSFVLPKSGVKVLGTKTSAGINYATLRLTENKAISYELV